MKKFLSLFFVLVALVGTLSGCINTGTNDGGSGNGSGREREFYNLVSESQELLDEVADDIYSYWYDCIYNDMYRDDINYAISMAIADNSSNISRIKSNNDEIKSLYGEVKDGDLKAEVKAVMQAYNDYYSLVIEVSGSFKSFSTDKETLKKELSSSLKDLEFEL